MDVAIILGVRGQSLNPIPPEYAPPLCQAPEAEKQPSLFFDCFSGFPRLSKDYLHLNPLVFFAFLLLVEVAYY